MTDALWQPSSKRIANSKLTAFRDTLLARAPELADADYPRLQEWSVSHRGEFWSAVWDFCGVIGERGAHAHTGDGLRTEQFFPEARLNFAQNLLERGGAQDVALRYLGEDGETLALTRGELQQQVARVARYFKQLGLKPGDRVAAMLPNRPEAVIAMLATTSLGAVWSSCSPDFGHTGVLDRFGQIQPTLFIACAHYHYGGKRFDTTAKAQAIQATLPSLKATILLTDADTCPSSFLPWSELIAGEDAQLEYAHTAFNAPLYILYSSGTTGAPKCIVHGVGGTLLQHLKEHQLQADIHAGEAVFYFSTCGWMMWNWLVSALASNATVLLYDGSPFSPDADVLFNYVSQAKASFMGVSAKFIDALKAQGQRPADRFELPHLRTIASTGSPLVPESFDYIYAAIKNDVAVHSISGGTDIVSCFVLGNPWQAVYRGEIQGKALGMAVDVCDPNGNSLPAGQKGDLICRAAFPCMPLGFWNDEDGERYQSAYFSRFKGVWHHGDYAELTPHGGLIIHGRSDATLNPGGVRIGTAEIYRQVEQVPEVLEALAIGQPWDNDVRIVLFLILKSGHTLDDAMRQQLRSQIRAGASPRHVPAKILQVSDFPRTRSGKLAEIAVRDIIQGRQPGNVEALSNPQALALFQDLPELQIG